MAVANQITGFNVGQYGEAIPLTVVDINGNAINISSYTGAQVVLRSPDYLKTVTYTAYYTNGGTDGNLYFTPQTGDIDRRGDWLGQLVLTATGLISKTVEFTLTVGDSLS